MIDAVANLAQVIGWIHGCARAKAPCSWCVSLADRTANHARNHR